MRKTRVYAFLSTVLMFPAFTTWGAVERETFELYIAIPSADFHVLPVDPQLVHVEQRLTYNRLTAQLTPLRASFDVKNANGAIGARLGEAAYLSNGRDRIDLRVTFNNVELSLDSTPVVSASEARPGKVVGLEVAAIKPDDGYWPGQYNGTVHMVFDAIAP